MGIVAQAGRTARCMPITQNRARRLVLKRGSSPSKTAKTNATIKGKKMSLAESGM